MKKHDYNSIIDDSFSLMDLLVLARMFCDDKIIKEFERLIIINTLNPNTLIFKQGFINQINSAMNKFDETYNEALDEEDDE